MHGIFFTWVAVPERSDQVVNDDDGFYYNVLQNTQNLVISRCCFAEDGKEMYTDLSCTCTAIVLLIKSFV